MKKVYCILIFIVFFFCFCSMKETDTMGGLFFSTEVSPNEAYIDEEEDKVIYTIQVYQDDDNVVTVCADSNSEFFEGVQYELAHSERISKSDINITWTTIMGNSEASEEDLWALANVSISSSEKVISERTINFISGAIKTIFEIIEQ